MTSTLTSKGQVTIPKAIRDQLRLSEGDQLEFILYPDGTLSLIPKVHDVRELQSSLPPPARTLSLGEMDEIIAQVGEYDRD